MAKKQLITEETIEKTTKTTIRTIEEHALPTLEIIEGKVFCTSLQVAIHFEKNHKEVLRDIDEQIAKIKAGHHAGKEAEMFLRGFYETKAGFGNVKKPMYYLNRDGFMKLVMGYNGARASDIQMDYIEAFNKMEAMLLSMRGMSVAPVKYLSNAQVQELKAQVDHLARSAWVKEACTRVIWNRLRFLANADTQLTIPADQFEVLKAELRRMEHVMYKGSRGTDSLIELMNEIQEYAYREVLCLGTPLSGTTHKDWRKKFGSLIPQGMGWRKAALILDELKASDILPTN